ncbi:FkbM family methyltransferase [Pseudomonas sp. CBMAI 2609]|uniref:FkbM family methyltransferase n=1 Tax=Pseudomonas flavocrustae TaxID=2991719 RepID=A0ABT6IHP9_9PSED|nr:FkbM family methyltransferase [Pseudomonas sp. CBMAI 2609]MDH4763365.1 FkbM family methyltransferase [Pseudomonas sp. CBMAI 2609]
MISYSQCGEDIYLDRCFKGKKSGFYIDIGASHPVTSNPAYHFYQMGWSGINVEPTPFRLSELKRGRPRDINLGCAISNRKGVSSFNITASADHISSLGKISDDLVLSHNCSVKQIQVEVMSLAELCEQYVSGDIDFLKVDVEGSEHDVLIGANWKRWRPKVVLVESVDAATGEPNWDFWEHILLENKYIFAFFDGVNRYYVATEHADLLSCFNSPVNPFDGANVYSSYGSPLRDTRHPDHMWSMNFANVLLASASIESDDHLFKALTWDLLAEELCAPADKHGIDLAFKRILNRLPSAADYKHWENEEHLPLCLLYKILVSGEEFRLKRTRVSSFSVWRTFE